MALDEPFEGEEQRHTELREAIDRIAEAAAKKAATATAKEVGEEEGKRQRRSARAYFALVLVLLVGATAYSHVQEGRLHDGLLASCARVDVLRLETNRNTQVLWAAFYAARTREQGLAGMGGRDARLHARSVAYIDRSLAAMRWTPSTDCRAAVDNPHGYRAPEPRPFTRRFLDLRVVPK